MEITDLMQKMSKDIENILKPYYMKLANTYTFEYLSEEIIHKLNEYQYENDIICFEVRLRSARDLVIAFEAQGLDIAFLYCHLVDRYCGKELKFNIDIYPLKH